MKALRIYRPHKNTKTASAQLQSGQLVPKMHCRIDDYWLSLSAILLLSQSTPASSDSAVTNFSDVLCGKRGNKNGRIVGGMPSKSGEFPWIVSIKKQTSHNCGGVVVNKGWVMTAAHCFCNDFATDKFSISVSRNGFRNVSSQNIKISKLMLHPGYSCHRLENDIALLQLKVDISWINADPACFPGIDQPSFNGLENVQAIAAGWGATNEDLSLGTVPSVLHKVELPILENEECQKWYRSQNKSLSLQKSQMCAGIQNGGKDTCWADSGGPLMVKNGANLVVVGIVSTGIGCARASLPGIYTRLTEYIDWISKSIS